MKVILSIPDEGYYVPDEGYSRNASCPRNLISTYFYLHSIRYLLKFAF